MRNFLWMTAIKGFLLGGFYPIWQNEILTRGSEVSFIATIIAIESLVSFLIDLPTGIIADRFGHKFVSIVGLTTYCVGFALPTLTSTPIALAGTVISIGIGNAFLSGAFQMWRANITFSEEGDSGLFSVLPIAVRDQMERLGMMAGALLLPLIFERLGFSKIFSWTPYLVVSIVLVLIAKNTNPGIETKKQKSGSTFRINQISHFIRSIQDIGYVPVLAAAALFGASEGILSFVFWPHLIQMGISTPTALGIFMFSMSLSRWIGIELWKRTNFLESNFAPGFCVLVSSIFILGFSHISHPPGALAFWMLRIAIGSAFYVTSEGVLLKLLHRSDRPATFLSLASVMGSIASIGIAFSGSILKDITLIDWFNISGLLALATGFIWTLISYRMKSDNKIPSPMASEIG